MSGQEFVTFQVASIRGYADIQVAAGIWIRRGARKRAVGEIRRLLPQGLRTPGHFCWTVRERPSGDAVGHLWVAEIASSGRREAFIYDIEIDPAWRGRGYGAATLRALTTWARRRKIPIIRLRVHAHNTVAQALYEKMGFVETDVMMALRVKRASQPRHRSR